jgi:hypothetical protein
LRQVSVLGNVTGAASETRQSAESVLTTSQAVEAAAADLRYARTSSLSSRPDQLTKPESQ